MSNLLGEAPPLYGVYHSVGQIPFATWQESGVKVPVFDKDHTVTNYQDRCLLEDVIKELKNAEFPDIYPAIGLVSNSRATEAVRECGVALQRALGVEVVTVTRADGPYPRKPHPRMGRVAAMKLGATGPEQVGVIGDRRFTDVAFGSRLGAGAIALCDRVGDVLSLIHI